MKKNNFSPYLTLILILSYFFVLFVRPPSVYANMLGTPEQMKWLAGYFIIGIIILFLGLPMANSLVESFVAKLILGKNYFSKSFLISLIKVNFISYYPAMILFTSIGILALNLKISIPSKLQTNLTFVIVEFLVVIAEFFLLRWQFNKLYSKSLLPAQVTDGQIMKISLSANLASFLVGSVVLEIFRNIPAIIGKFI